MFRQLIPISWRRRGQRNEGSWMGLCCPGLLPRQQSHKIFAHIDFYLNFLCVASLPAIDDSRIDGSRIDIALA